MEMIEKCLDCDRWKYTHNRSTHIPERDLVCSLCRSSVLLNEQNDLLEESIVHIRQG